MCVYIFFLTQAILQQTAEQAAQAGLTGFQWCGRYASQSNLGCQDVRGVEGLRRAWTLPDLTEPEPPGNKPGPLENKPESQELEHKPASQQSEVAVVTPETQSAIAPIQKHSITDMAAMMIQAMHGAEHEEDAEEDTDEDGDADAHAATMKRPAGKRPAGNMPAQMPKKAKIEKKEVPKQAKVEKKKVPKKAKVATNKKDIYSKAYHATKVMHERAGKSKEACKRLAQQAGRDAVEASECAVEKYFGN